MSTHGELVAYIDYDDWTRVDGTVHLWDPATGATVGEALRYRGIFDSGAISADSELMATTDDDLSFRPPAGVERVRVWDLTTGRQAYSPIQHRGEVATMAFSPAGDVLATAVEG
jgi:WD40 repeat protein